MEKQYSIAIHPPEEAIALVKSMKEQLAKEVGWFHSKNSVGHITICLFKATDIDIEQIKIQLIQLCDTLEPVDVRLNELGSYRNGAFFISPDEESKNNLKPIMKKVQDSINIQDMQISNDPHLSIARQLTWEKLKKANQLFPTINISWLCDSIVLRQFDENLKQYFVTDTLIFKGNSQKEF